MSGDDDESTLAAQPLHVKIAAGPSGVRRTLVVQNMRDERGWLLRELHADEDGTLVIEGQDLGSGVSDFWGDGLTEYEFTRTLSPVAVAALRLSLGIGDAPVLEALGSRFETTGALEQYLEAHGIESSFWSRVGD